jgi:hypothetical protein
MEYNALSSVHQPDGGILIYSGDRLTIENSAEFSKLIAQGLAEAKSVAIEFAANLEADITALQVLCSAHKTAATQGKIFTRQGDMPAALLNLAVAVGSERHRECNHNKGNPCPWFEGEKEWQR